VKEDSMSARLNINPKTLTIYLTFTLIVSALQYMLMLSFLSDGLIDVTQLKLVLGENLEISLSILLHLIPLNTVLVLLLCLNYLIKSSTMEFKKQASGKQIKKVSYAGEKSLFAEALKVSLRLIFLLCLLSLIILPALCPLALYKSVLNLYKTIPALKDVVYLFEGLHSFLVATLGPYASAFRSSLWPMVDPLIRLDDTWRYLISQNLISWLTSALAILYVRQYRRKV
jgi:hypothetical protein